MKKILITRKLIASSEKHAAKLFDVKLNKEDKLLTKEELIKESSGCDGILSAITDKEIPYVGLLGPSKRREKLINELIERDENLSDNFLDQLYGPTGINIGAETPQEIAISIIAEILTIIREQKPISLKDKSQGIHQ